MNVKRFLTPDWRKFSLMLIFFLIYYIFGWYLLSSLFRTEYPSYILINYPLARWTIPNPPRLSNLILFAIFYLVSCLVVSFYDKIKKRKIIETAEDIFSIKKEIIKIIIPLFIFYIPIVIMTFSKFFVSSPGYDTRYDLSFFEPLAMFVFGLSIFCLGIILNKKDCFYLIMSQFVFSLFFNNNFPFALTSTVMVLILLIGTHMGKLVKIRYLPKDIKYKGVIIFALYLLVTIANFYALRNIHVQFLPYNIHI